MNWFHEKYVKSYISSIFFILSIWIQVCQILFSMLPKYVSNISDLWKWNFVTSRKKWIWAKYVGFFYLMLSMIRLYYDHLVPFLHIGGSNWVWVFRCVPDILGQKVCFWPFMEKTIDWKLSPMKECVPKSNLMMILPPTSSKNSVETGNARISSHSLRYFVKSQLRKL